MSQQHDVIRQTVNGCRMDHYVTLKGRLGILRGIVLTVIGDTGYQQLVRNHRDYWEVTKVRIEWEDTGVSEWIPQGKDYFANLLRA